MSRVCLDASIWIKILTQEPGTALAENLVIRLLREKVEIIAPTIMKIEVGSVLRKKWRRKLLDTETLHELWGKFVSLPIVYVDNGHLYDQAWEIAEANGLTQLYDAMYLAVSEGVEYWTADERLVNSIKTTRVKVKLLNA
ncbi:type II toxin-antitoxin system VapC family toxin [Paenibacillus alkalitolerans]|uniref:type II toxin-antitoxin system VapC family toxin n=1 Tax=Paenibacillus alkalitolerans TaxID=2799335 RepID=UPI0018F7AC7E|nr:type II toxin-antitoxin system VapC family toxin [Paenibacillus alkalitolerans]